MHIHKASDDISIADVISPRAEDTVFRAKTTVFAGPQLFGGQALGVAVVAAAHSAGATFDTASVHAQLLAPGRAGQDLAIAVESVRDGGRTRHRRVVLSQQEDIAHVTALFSQHQVDDGEIQDSELQEFVSPRVPVPTPTMGRDSPFVTKWGFGDLLDVHHASNNSIHPMWLRPRVPLPNDSAIQAAAIAFVSDFGLVLAAKTGSADTMATPVTTDHAIWFHGPPRFTDWLLLDAKPAVRHGDHALVSAHLFAPSGSPVATIMQGVRFRRTQ